jgi:hypothetical protein
VYRDPEVDGLLYRCHDVSPCLSIAGVPPAGGER